MLASLDKKTAKPLRAGVPKRDAVANEVTTRDVNPLWQSLALTPLSMQRKLAVGQADDPHEHEADRVADGVVRITEAQVQRKCACGGKCPKCEANQSGELDHPQLQRVSRTPSQPLVGAPASVERALTGPGRSLDPTFQQEMEVRLGYDLSGVRLHTDFAAEESARDVNAHAYTVGNDIVFGAGQFAPGTHGGRWLLAHELTHVVQQTGGAAPIIRRKEHEQGWTTITQITVGATATGVGRGGGLTLAGQTLPITIEVNNLSVGTHEMAGLSGKPVWGEWNRIHVNSLTANLFVYLLPPGVTVAQEIAIIVKPSRSSLYREIRGLRKDIRDYLMSGKGPPASDEVLQNVLRVGRALETAGVSEEELLLLQYADAPIRPLGEGLGGYLEQRDFEISQAQDTREELIKHGNLLASLDSFPYPLPPLASLQNLFPRSLEILDRQLLEDSRFRSVVHLRETINLFANAFDQEVFGLAMAVLNGVEVGLIKMEARFVGHLPERRGSPSNLVAELNKIKANPKVNAALEALRREKESDPTILEQASQVATTGVSHKDKIEKLEQKVDETVGETSLLKLFSGTSVALLEAKTGEAAQQKLIDFILDGRATVRRARAALDLDNPGSLYWDKIVAAQKARMGIQSGSWMDRVINQIVQRGRSATSFWDKVWNVLKVIIMFLPGPLGFALRTVAAVIDTDKSISEYRRKLDAFNTGMSSEKPDPSALYTQIAFTAAGVGIDASLTRFVPKGGGSTPVKTSGSVTRTTEHEAANVIKAEGDVAAKAQAQAGKGTVIKGGEKQAEEIAQKEIKNIGATTEGALNQETVTFLSQKSNAQLRTALAENSLAARALKKCNTPCYPPDATAEQVRKLEQHLGRLKATGKYDENMLREYLYSNRNDLDNAINEVIKNRTSRHLDSFLAKETRMPIGPVRRVPPREDPRMAAEVAGRAHDIGVKHGREYAVKQLKLKGINFKNPFESVGKYGQGFDDIMIVGADLDNGIIYIVEYKGGTAGLSAGQMELEWVVGNIRRLFFEGGTEGQEIARKLSKALREGRLKGVALSTPLEGNAAKETIELATWVYDGKKSALSF